MPGREAAAVVADCPAAAGMAVGVDCPETAAAAVVAVQRRAVESV